jgi:hypothetical protein
MPPLVKNNMLTLPVGTTPEYPDPGEVALFIDSSGIVYQLDKANVTRPVSGALNIQTMNGTNYGNAGILRLPRGARVDLGSNNISLQVMPRLPARNRFIGLAYNPDNSAWSSVPGNITFSDLSGTNQQSFKNKHPMMRAQNIAAIASVAGCLPTSGTNQRVQYNPFYSVYMHTDTSIADQRIWCGLFSAAPGNVATLGAVSAVGFGYFSSDGNLSWVTSNGTTTTRTTMVTMAADTTYKLSFWVVGVTAYFQINNGVIASTTTTLPAAATNLGFYLRVVSTTAVQQRIYVGQLYGESD